MTDLWPEDVGEALDLTPPVSILTEQASLLGTKTQNMLKAEVLRDQFAAPDEFVYGFYIVAPALGNYRYKLFSIKHGAELYPVRILVGPDMSRELRDAGRVKPSAPITDDTTLRISVDSEEAFYGMLKAIFGTQKTRRIVQGMLAQVGQPPQPIPEAEIPF